MRSSTSCRAATNSASVNLESSSPVTNSSARWSEAMAAVVDCCIRTGSSMSDHASFIRSRASLAAAAAAVFARASRAV